MNKCHCHCQCFAARNARCSCITCHASTTLLLLQYISTKAHCQSVRWANNNSLYNIEFVIVVECFSSQTIEGLLNLVHRKAKGKPQSITTQFRRRFKFTPIFHIFPIKQPKNPTKYKYVILHYKIGSLVGPEIKKLHSLCEIQSWKRPLQQ